MSFTLDELVTSKPEPTVKTAEVDVTDLFPERGEPVVFTYRELTTAELFRIPEEAETIRFQQPHWSPSLCQQVALLSVCHVAPTGKMATAILYATLVNRLPMESFAALTNRFMKEFPELRDFAAAVSSEKNG